MADTRIGGVYATFRADNNPWLRASQQNVNALRRQSQATRRLQRDARDLRASVRGLVGALGVFAGGAGLAALTRGAFNAGRSLSALGSSLVENSNRLAITAEQIQLLGRVFEGGGASQEEFLKGFRTFNRNLIDAQNGLETYRRVFRLVGVDVDEAARTNQSAFETFLQLSDGLSRVENQAIRVNVAQTLLGRGGTALLFELQKGRRAILENAEAFRGLGLVTDDQAARLKALEQSYVDTSNAIRTAQAQIVADNGELFQAFNRFIAEAVPAAFNRLVEVIDLLRRNLGIVTRAFGIFLGLLISRSAFGRFVASVATATTALVGFRAGIAATVAALRTLGRVAIIGALVEGLFLVIDVFAAVRAEAERTGQRMQDIFANVAESIGRNIAASIAESLTIALRTVASAPELIFAEVSDQLLGDARNRSREILDEIAADGAAAAELVNLAFGATATVAAQQGERVVDNIIARVRERYQNIFTDAPALPPLPPPVDVPFRSGEQGFAREANAIRERANALLSDQRVISDDILQSTRERAEAADRELSFLRRGLEETDARRVVEEGLEQQRIAQRRLLADLDRNQARQAALRSTQREAEEAGLFNVSAELAKQINIERQKAQEITTQIELNMANRDALASQLEIYGQVIERAAAQTEVIERQRRLWATVEQSVEDFGVSAITNFRNIGDAARALGNTILQAFTRALVIQPLLGALGLGGGGFGFPPGFQRGGFADRGFALVGEGGPEVVDFRNPGRVYTNEQLASALSAGGGGETFVFAPVIQSADSDAVRRAVAEAFPIFQAQVEARRNRDLTRPSKSRSSVRRA